MTPIDRLVFHIGVLKTGSSLIQKALRNLREPLAARGITYVDRKDHLVNPYYRAWAPYGREAITVEQFQTWLREDIDRRRQNGPGSQHTVLTSNEAASGRHRDFGMPFWERAGQAVAEVVEALEPAATEVVVYVRRQDGFLESMYMELIHMGLSTPWEEFADTTCGDDRVRFTELLRDVAAVPTVDRVTVKPFEAIRAGGHAFVADFLDIVGAGELVDELRPSLLRPARQSLTQPAWQAALKINGMLDGPDQAAALRKFLTDLFPRDRYPKAQLLSPDERERLIAIYREENRRLFEQWLPQFPTDSYGSATAIQAVERALQKSGAA